jgi:hypothetical protein
MINDNKIYQLELKYKPNPNVNNNYKYIIRDSFLLLPTSLRKLGDTILNTDQLGKGVFPYNFVTENLNY